MYSFMLSLYLRESVISVTVNSERLQVSITNGSVMMTGYDHITFTLCMRSSDSFKEFKLYITIIYNLKQ